MSRYLKVIGFLSFVFLISIFLAACPVPGGMHSETFSITAATGNITGKVLAQGQTDNSGVSVTAELTDGIKSDSVQKMLSARQAIKAVVSAQATTDSSGSYTLSGLSPGVYTLSAVSKDGLEKAVTTSVTVSAGSTAQALLMILTQTGQIKGTVTLGDGQDPTGIVVFIAGTSYSAMTDIKGNYLMSYVPAGKNYTLVASKTGYVSAIRNVDVTVNKTTPVASIALAPYVAPQTTGSVSGTATLKDAPTSAGIFVYLVGTSHICVTDPDGKFSLTGVAPNTYTIMASREGYSAQSGPVIIEKGQDAHASFTLIAITPVFVYSVTYDGNGGTGTVPVGTTAYLQGQTVTVLGNSGSLVKAGYSFAGWNTKADGGGISYAPGQTFIMGGSDVVLSAMWTPVPQDNSWIIGLWTERPYAPNSDLTEIDANGMAYHYDNVDGSGLLGSFTWTFNGDVLTLDGTMEVPITRISDDEFILGMSIPGHLYRKTPAGNIFAQSETVLSSGVWTAGTVAKDDRKLFSFTAPSAGSYQISWEDSKNAGGAYTGDVRVAAYKSDQATSFFTGEWGPSQTVSLGAGEKMFVIVDGKANGTFRIMVGPIGTAPEFVGTWTMTITTPIVATITWTFTSTTLHSFVDAGASGTATLDGNVSGVDETLKHIIVTYTAIENTGGFVAYEHPGDFVYGLYEVSGNMLKIESNGINVATFPTAFSSGAITFTKVP